MNEQNLIDELFDLVTSTVASWTNEKQKQFDSNEGYRNSVIYDSSFVIDGITDENRNEITSAVEALVVD